MVSKSLQIIKLSSKLLGYKSSDLQEIAIKTTKEKTIIYSIKHFQDDNTKTSISLTVSVRKHNQFVYASKTYVCLLYIK